MEQVDEYELIVSQGKLPWWKIIIASLFFSSMIYWFYVIFITFYKYEVDDINPKYIAYLIKYATLSLAGGISFSITKNILIDIDKNKLISVYMVGPFSRKVTTVVPELEYVSVFFNDKEQYEVNLWYSKNKHYKMYMFEDSQTAFEFAAQVIKKLNIDLLDATKKGNSKWIDKSQL